MPDQPTDPAGTGGAPRALTAISLIAVVLVLVVLAAPLVGPWQFEPRFEPAEVAESTGPTEPVPTAEPSASDPVAPDVPESDLQLPDLRWLLVLGAVLMGLVLLALAVRLVLWLRRPTPPPPPDPGVLAGAGEISEEPQIPVLHRGVRAAVSHLEQIRVPPRDAIVAAWLALEEAAARSGVRRRPAQTPTEFTTAVLTRTGADEQAVTRLLGLYHRARFSTTNPTRADVVAATEAFAALTASWPALIGAEDGLGERGSEPTAHSGGSPADGPSR